MGKCLFTTLSKKHLPPNKKIELIIEKNRPCFTFVVDDQIYRYNGMNNMAWTIVHPLLPHSHPPMSYFDITPTPLKISYLSTFSRQFYCTLHTLCQLNKQILYRVRQRGCSLTHSARTPPAVHPGITIWVDKIEFEKK